MDSDEYEVDQYLLQSVTKSKNKSKRKRKSKSKTDSGLRAT